MHVMKTKIYLTMLLIFLIINSCEKDIANHKEIKENKNVLQIISNLGFDTTNIYEFGSNLSNFC